MLAIDAFRQDAWTRQDPRLPSDWPALTPHWHCDHALGTDYARRQALVEVDVLAARDDDTHTPDHAERQTVYDACFDSQQREGYYEIAYRYCLRRGHTAEL